MRTSLEVLLILYMHAFLSGRTHYGYLWIFLRMQQRRRLSLLAKFKKSPKGIILFEDNQLLVLNKPPGVPINGDISGDDNLLDTAKQYLVMAKSKPGAAFLGLVHRLDRAVSGTVVFGKTSKCSARLSESFRNRQVHKKYVCVVEGLMPEAAALCEDTLLIKEGNNTRCVSSDTPGGQFASLQYRAVSVPQAKCSVLEVLLLTGRKHQIRAQLAHRGHPIVGDVKYGSRSKPYRMGFIALHSASLTFHHPTTRRQVSFISTPPASWTNELDGNVMKEVHRSIDRLRSAPLLNCAST